MSTGFDTEISAGPQSGLRLFAKDDAHFPRDSRLLEAEEREDRIRTVFGLERNQSLPQVGRWALRAYYEYLADHLALPFRARYWDESNPLQGDCHVVTVVGLINPRKRRCDDSSGLVCLVRIGKRLLEVPLAELELRGDAANSALIEDYWFWFWNWR